MTNESDISQLRAQIEELQTQLVFQEDTIAGLNEALAAQQVDLEWVKRQWEIMRERFAELQAAGGDAVADVASEKPPHY